MLEPLGVIELFDFYILYWFVKVEFIDVFQTKNDTFLWV